MTVVTDASQQKHGFNVGLLESTQFIIQLKVIDTLLNLGNSLWYFNHSFLIT